MKISQPITILLMALLLSYTASFDASTNYSFEQFQKQFGRTYQGQQREQHRKAFNKNYQELLDAKKKSGDQYEVQVNGFLDMTDQEKAKFLNYKPKQLKVPYDSTPSYNKLRAIALPTQLNYTAKGKVTPIKNQGKCGACWAFTSAAIYQSQLLINGAGQYDLSEQYVLSCTEGASCDGGWPNSALNMLSDNGIATQSQYPFKGDKTAYQTSQICSQSNLIKLPLQVQSINHYNSVPQIQLKQMLLDNGPLSVGVKASDNGFLFYGGGVFSGCNSVTTQEQIDHVLLLIGWTKEGDWIVKNSWGKNWGDNGYGVIDGTRNCGISSFVDALVLAKPKPTEDKLISEGASVNQIDNLKVKLTDSYGDGWNGYIFGLRQKNSIVTVFGESFKSGAEQITEVEIPSGVETEVVVVVSGSNSKDIGFKISDGTGKQLCSRQPGSKFSNQIIFCTFCIDCEVSDRVTYQISLYDVASNGWNGNVLSFEQNSASTKIGQQFVSGQKYGPRRIEFRKNVPVEIFAEKVGERPQDISFIVRDTFGNIVFQRRPGSSFSPDSKLGEFCPGCKNLFLIKTSQQLANDYPQYSQNEVQNTKFKAVFIGVVVTLSVLLLALLGAFLYLLKKKNKQMLLKTRQSLPSQSMVMSQNTIPDESPENQKSEGEKQIRIN